MKRHSKRSSADSDAGGRLRTVAAACCLLLVASGCESMQRKFVRKSKAPREKHNPVVQFQDYSSLMTPVDRYQKHYAVFGYWNSELMDALNGSVINPKKIREASAESLQELQQLQGLLDESLAAQLQPSIDTRARIDRRIQADNYVGPQFDVTRRELEAQTRSIQRSFYWRDVQDHLKQDIKQDAGVTADAAAH